MIDKVVELVNIISNATGTLVMEVKEVKHILKVESISIEASGMAAAYTAYAERI